MKIRVSEATPVQLNWMVARCVDEGFANFVAAGWPYDPSTDWAHGGPIIDRKGISIVRDEGDDYWQAVTDANSGSMFGPGLCGNNFQHGPTPLIAAMRCHVTSELGDEVEIPDELV